MASATNDNRTAAVTIHRGELAQIRKLIAVSNSTAGDLYGLWTHSFQPVVQLIVCPNVCQIKSSSCEAFINDNYGLRLLGRWCGAKKGCAAPGLPQFTHNKRYVNVEFLLEENELSLSDSEVMRGPNRTPEKGKLEILPGQSSFRLCKNLLGRLKLQASINVTEEDRAAVKDLRREAEVKEDQWYSTEYGKEILKFLHQNFSTNGDLQLLEISRNTETHNIGFSLKYQRHHDLRLEFPANFPKSALTLLCGNQEIQVKISTENGSKEPEEFAGLICGLVLSKLDEYVTERAKAEKKKRTKKTNAQGVRQNLSGNEMKNDNQEEEKQANDDTRPHGGNLENTQDTDMETKNLLGDQTTTDSVEIAPGGSVPKNENPSIRKTEGKGKTAAPSSVDNNESATGSENVTSATGNTDTQMAGDPMEGVEFENQKPKNADPFTKEAEGEGKTPVPSSSSNGEGLVLPTSSRGEIKDTTTGNENRQILNPTGNGDAAKSKGENQNNEDEAMDTEL